MHDVDAYRSTDSVPGGQALHFVDPVVFVKYPESQP